ncbi:MAG TPA: hypothetical protein VLB67_16355 [Acidimicrobiia bacterium]|nr:hypothetical protein [Acidimicrobiia bacterium]
MTRSILTTAALLVASLAAALVLTGPAAIWAGGSGALLAVGHLILTAVTIVGALVGAARWSVGLGAALAAFLALPAILHPIDPAWGAMVGAAGLALAGTLGTGLRASVRQRPPADAPPRTATALALGLLAMPMVVAVAQPSGIDLGDWLLATAGVLLAAWYTRARPSALWTARLALPALIAVTFVLVPLPGAIGVAAGWAALAWLAWTAGARLAVIPLAAPGHSVRIPPELAPGEILDAAGLDDRGHRKETT